MSFHVRPESLDWALSHVEKHGDTDIFPVAFEFSAIRHCWAPGNGYGEIRSRGLRELIRAIDISAWSLRPHRRCIAPKNRFGFRIATQLDPIDTLLLTATTYELGIDLEASRIPLESRVVHSYRFRPGVGGDMFDPAYGYRTFLKKTQEQVGRFGWVVTADIADFYPRVYSHPLENALRVATGNDAAVRALVRFLDQLNQGVSYGLPVGPSASRLLAEVVLSDVDRLLLSERIDFVRFVDDYRIFSRTERDAHNALAKLANFLFENHGLTLQQHKTHIYSSSAFLDLLSPAADDLERTRLSEAFDEIVEQLGLDDPYEPIVYEDLSPELQAQVDRLNLDGILAEQCALAENASPLTLRFLMRRFGQLGDHSAINRLCNAPRALYLVLHAFSDYVEALATSGSDASMGRRLLGLMADDILGHLEFNRAWLLQPFSKQSTLNCLSELTALLLAGPQQLERRELILALGAHRASDWINTNRRAFDQESPWCRRAFLASARSLPGDQAEHWYRAVRPQLDLLEQAVSIWAEQLP